MKVRLCLGFTCRLDRPAPVAFTLLQCLHQASHLERGMDTGTPPRELWMAACERALDGGAERSEIGGVEGTLLWEASHD